MKYLVLLQCFWTKMHTGNLQKRETERDAVKYKKSKHTMAAPERKPTLTQMSHHTRHFIVCHLQPMNCTPKKIPKNSVHNNILDLTWLLLKKKRLLFAYRESWYWRELGPTMQLLRLQRFFFIEWDQFIYWNFWQKLFTLGSWLNLTFCHPTSQDTHIKFCASQGLI